MIRVTMWSLPHQRPSTTRIPVKLVRVFSFFFLVLCLCWLKKKKKHATTPTEGDLSCGRDDSSSTQSFLFFFYFKENKNKVHLFVFVQADSVHREQLKSEQSSWELVKLQRFCVVEMLKKEEFLG